MGQLGGLSRIGRRNGKIHYKKQTFSLLELLVALALSASLLTVLFQFLVSHFRFQQSLEKAQKTLIGQQRLREKIHSIFVSLEPNAGKPPLYTMQRPKEKFPSLVACFDAGIDPDPSFSGPNLCHLYIDSDRRLCLAQWPSGKGEPRIEVLAEQIESLEWEFLGNRMEKTTPATPISGTAAWLHAWAQTNRAPPPVIRLKMWQGVSPKKQVEPNIKLAFILPQQDPIGVEKDS